MGLRIKLSIFYFNFLLCLNSFYEGYFCLFLFFCWFFNKKNLVVGNGKQHCSLRCNVGIYLGVYFR